MHSGPGVLSAAQMVPEGHGGEDEAEIDDERVGGEAPEGEEEGQSPLRPCPLNGVRAEEEVEEEEEEVEEEVEAGEDEVTAAGGAGDGPERLTKPKRLSVSKLAKTLWPQDSLAAHVLLEVVTSGGPAPKIISLSSSVELPGAGTLPAPFHAYVKTTLTANKNLVRTVHGLDLAAVREDASGFETVGAEWLAWLARAVPSGAPCVLCSWGGLKEGHFSLLPLELKRHGLSLPPRVVCVDLKLDSKRLKTVSAHATKGSDALGLAVTMLESGSSAPAWLTREAQSQGPQQPAARRQLTSPRPPTAAALAAALKAQPPELATCAALSVLLAPVRKAASKAAVCVAAAAFEQGKAGWAAHYAYEVQQLHDPVPTPWREHPVGWHREATPPMDHGELGPRFSPKAGVQPKGGPSRHLREHLRAAAEKNREDERASTEQLDRWRRAVEGGGSSPAPPPTAPEPPPPRHTRRSGGEVPASALPQRTVANTVLRRARRLVPPSRATTAGAPAAAAATAAESPQPQGRRSRPRADANTERHEGLTLPETLLALFEYYFDEEIVQLIVDATNAKAHEPVVKLSRGRLRAALADDDPAVVRKRAENWSDVTLEEMYVFLGIRILMGGYHRWIRPNPNPNPTHLPTYLPACLTTCQGPRNALLARGQVLGRAPRPAHRRGHEERPPPRSSLPPLVRGCRRVYSPPLLPLRLSSAPTAP